MKKSTLIALLSIVCATSFAQYTTNKVVGEKNQAYLDSIKNAEYPYVLPILGKQATRKGFKLQLPAGLSLNYLGQQSDIVINNLQVGFNNGPKYNLDEIIRFNSAEATTDGLNFRPDLWLFPFLNVYGIFARSKTSTSIDAGIWIPDSSDIWHEVTSFSTKANFEATTMGFGVTPTMGVGGFFMAFDMNFTWSDIDALEKPAFAFIFDPRIGKNFTLNDKDMNLAVWAGGFRVKINSNTSGSLPLSDLFSTEDLEAKIDASQADIEQSQQEVEDWWNGLSSLEQKNPVNEAKYNAANKALAAAGNFFVAAEGAVNGIHNSSVQYSLDKKQKEMWNFMIGGQYQYNKHWMVRGEAGFLGSRTHLIAGLQYRFGL